VLSIAAICSQLDLSPAGLYDTLAAKGYSHIFHWSWSSPRNFFKLMLTGFLLTVMTNGLDQSVMQKHLTCKTLWDSQKNLISLAFILIVVNLLFLFLGGSLQLFAEARALPIPEMTDNLYPILAVKHLGPLVATLFLIGIAAAAYSSADSSLTGLTTSFCVDILPFDLDQDDRPRLRQGIHLGFTLLLFVLIMVFQQVNESSVLHAFIRTSGFVYGPLAGLFAFGLMSKKRVPDAWLPFVCILCPLLAFLLDQNGEAWLGYTFGYDILVFNTLLTLVAIYLLTFIPPKNETVPAPL
jgi:Na+/proline symporter